MFNKVTLIEVKIKDKTPTTIESSGQTLSFETIAVYKDASGKTYDLNVSSQDQIKNNAEDYKWLSGNEKVSYIYSDGTLITPSTTSVSWSIDPNNNSYALEREVTAKYEGKQDVWTLIQANGDGGLTLPEEGKEEDDPVIETDEYYTFDVQPREVESSGGNVTLSATYYKNTTTDGDVSSENKDVTTDVTWYCNNSQISSNGSYSIPQNEDTETSKTFTFTTSYGSVPLNQTETQIVVRQNTPPVYIHRVLHITHLTGNCTIKGYLRCQLDFTLDSGEPMYHNFDQGYEFGTGWQTFDKESFRLRNEMYEQKVTSIKLTAQDMVDVGMEPNETDNPYNPIKSIYFTVTLDKRDGSSSVEVFYLEWFGTNYEDGNFRSTLLEITTTVSLSTPVRLIDISKIYVEVGYSHDPHEE